MMTESLTALLSGLCKTDEDREILAALEAVVEDFQPEGEIATFENGMEFEFNSPEGDVPRHPDVPASFHAISKVFGAVWWDGGGPEVGWALDDDGEPEADGWLFDEMRAEEPDEFAKIEAAGKVTASFMGGQNGLFFDPTRKLANGEPAMAFISHEGGGWEPVESVNDLDYGQILLRMISDAMIETDYIPEIYF